MTSHFLLFKDNQSLGVVPPPSQSPVSVKEKTDQMISTSDYLQARNVKNTKTSDHSRCTTICQRRYAECKTHKTNFKELCHYKENYISTFRFKKLLLWTFTAISAVHPWEPWAAWRALSVWSSEMIAAKAFFLLLSNTQLLSEKFPFKIKVECQIHSHILHRWI